ncbi:MAG: Flp pilus assembly complex ATPase component TadA [Planctomycetes bacterium]|nr:Flp pilus assembly complex ATPase component TadA [Planctomycetota bacterium]
MEKIGQILVAEKLITEEQLSQALTDQAQTNELLGAGVVRRGWVSESKLVEVLAKQFNLPVAQLDSAETDPALAQLVPAGSARLGKFVPMRRSGTTLEVAVLHPDDLKTLEQLTKGRGINLSISVAGPEAIERAITRLYGGASDTKKAGQGGAAQKNVKEAKPFTVDQKQVGEALTRAVQEAGGEVKDDKPEDKDIPRLEIAPLDPPIVRLVNGMLLEAISMRASDIHLEPLEEELRVRYRVDGGMIEARRLPNGIRSALTSRIKIMCSMNIAEKRVPQDGAIKVSLSEKEQIDFRVNTLPSIYGEKIVMRILGRGQLKNDVSELGFKARALELVTEAIANPFGMILVTGPTGSGKTTTLYTILQQLNDPDVNIVTAEDPVEYRLNGITQVNVRPAVNFTFDVALRSFLRQDPDMILVGEMRDFETAAIAVKAALTGHLVLSTLHTNDTASTVVRLVDMGIEPYLVASAVKLVIAQRLVRRICEKCKLEVPVSEAERTDADRATLAAVEKMYRGKGCDHCNNSGYRGRIPIFEVMCVKSRDMKRAITEGGTEVQVQQIAKREGTRTLADEAIDLVNLGITSLDEALKHIMVD